MFPQFLSFKGDTYVKSGVVKVGPTQRGFGGKVNARN